MLSIWTSQLVDGLWSPFCFVVVESKLIAVSSLGGAFIDFFSKPFWERLSYLGHLKPSKTLFLVLKNQVEVKTFVFFMVLGAPGIDFFFLERPKKPPTRVVPSLGSFRGQESHEGSRSELRSFGCFRVRRVDPESPQNPELFGSFLELPGSSEAHTAKQLHQGPMSSSHRWNLMIANPAKIKATTQVFSQSKDIGQQGIQKSRSWKENSRPLSRNIGLRLEASKTSYLTEHPNARPKHQHRLETRGALLFAGGRPTSRNGPGPQIGQRAAAFWGDLVLGCFFFLQKSLCWPNLRFSGRCSFLRGLVAGDLGDEEAFAADHQEDAAETRGSCLKKRKDRACFPKGFKDSNQSAPKTEGKSRGFSSGLV